MDKSLTKNIIQSVLVAVVMAMLGGVAKTYMAVHDLQITVQELKGKLDWLFQHDFPDSKE